MSNSFVTPWTIAHCPWDSSGENAGVGCHFLLQAIFLIQRLNPQLLPHLLLSHQGSPFSGNRSLSPTSLWLWNHDGDREHVNSTCLSCCHLKLFTSTLKPISLSTSPSPQPPGVLSEPWQLFLGELHSLKNLFFSEKEMAIHSTVLAWEIPWTEDPGGL